jgi:hypothetical protein
MISRGKYGTLFWNARLDVTDTPARSVEVRLQLFSSTA